VRRDFGSFDSQDVRLPAVFRILGAEVQRAMGQIWFDRGGTIMNMPTHPMSQRQGRTPRSAACRPAGRHVQNLRWLGLLACLAMASPAVAQPAGNAVGALQGGRKIAVVIGINQYDDKRIPGLNFCVNDSVQMYETLVNECGYRPDDVLLLMAMRCGSFRRVRT
jgi:hypothetical protein